MKKLSAIAALCVFSGAALAADLPVRSPAPAPVVFVPAYAWSGFYVGAQVGWMQLTDKFSEVYAPNPSGALVATTRDSSAFTGGVYGGYNWNWNGVVVGVEADIEGANAETGFTNYDPFAWRSATMGYNAQINWQGSLRARLGWTVNNWMVYFTGGVAFADVDTNYFDTTGARQSFGDSMVGWTLGTGVEWAFTPNWIARFEYRYADYGSTSNMPNMPNWSNFRDTHDLTTHALRVGLAYRFGGGQSAAPVMARY